ncbi:hypothetical protein BpHYR1_007789 [Brachionus plicatilis]|uniref:Secreted protein n=1 Tax=Brachionus plicatilis TaxID=10195 RepID=A0A3M7PRW2_BRAPC|nr:hypothetical protein BpHYR1_007789 [Brachionus plicatilis]
MPRMFPSLVPASLLTFSAACCLSLCSLNRLTDWHPLRQTIAMSDVGSFKGITGSNCLVNVILPSKNGGTIFLTIM